MKLLRKKGPSLDDRLDALAEAAGLADGRLPSSAVDEAKAVVAHAGVRRNLSVAHTAVALAGATGSGKSSLFNALAGAELATVGVTRPTTAAALAAMWDPQGSGPLLDWLDVPRRHEITGRSADLDGLILLDLPDHDSIEQSHRLEVDRLVAVVDLLVWVLDPQKYADAAVHERYLRPLAHHKDVTLVVLNQVDRLPPDAVERCLADLRRLLAEDGLEGVPVLAASARTGAGLSELRDSVARLVRRRRAWSARLAADVSSAAETLAVAAGTPAEGKEPAVRGKELVAALGEAAGVPLVVGAVAKAHRHRAIIATGWPVTRWLRRFRPDPLRRLRVAISPDTRTSLPAATAVQKSRMETAIRDAGGAAASGVPEPWAAAVRHAARSRSQELEERLDRAVATTSIGAARPPRWWRVIGVLQWLIFATMAVGALWLGALFVVSYLRLPDLPTPTAGELPWPTALLLGGAVAGVLVALLSRLAAWLGGRRRARKAAKALRAAIEDVARDLVITPLDDELSRYRRFTATLAQARQV
ncbi:50S ribosome-binding GTPase [Streptosporangiaceae bacterium NEAU-GS5]|nr:50S ribosome-binding GTPase [Streptosporangiaceae bacterium NEAU-GS5]